MFPTPVLMNKYISLLDLETCFHHKNYFPFSIWYQTCIIVIRDLANNNLTSLDPASFTTLTSLTQLWVYILSLNSRKVLPFVRKAIKRKKIIYKRYTYWTSEETDQIDNNNIRFGKNKYDRSMNKYSYLLCFVNR